MREPIANNLPAFVGEWRPFREEPATLREYFRDWRLYYTDVTDERHVGKTVWNTASGRLSGQINAQQAGEQWQAIDKWSRTSQIFYPIAIMLFIANFVFILLGLLACRLRKLGDLFPFALLMPFYWVLISIAAFKGFFQFFTNPWYWEKTEHGFTTPEPGAPSGPAEQPEPPTIDPSQEITGVAQNG